MWIAPSVLSADFAKLGTEIEDITTAGADWIHLDVMDGLFVPNITFGAPVIKMVRGFSNQPFDVHLMIQNPKRYIGDFLKAGADIISFHVEAEEDIDGTIDAIVAGGAKPALAVKPNTPIESVYPYLDKLYMVLGFVADKDLSKVLPLLPKEAHYIFTRAGIERALDENILARRAAEYGLQGETAPTVTAAVARARELARAEDMIYIGGSTFVVAEFL